MFFTQVPVIDHASTRNCDEKGENCRLLFFAVFSDVGAVGGRSKYEFENGSYLKLYREREVGWLVILQLSAI